MQKKVVDLSREKQYDLSFDDVLNLMQLLGVKGHIHGGSWETMSDATKRLFVYEIVSIYYEGKSRNVTDTFDVGS